MKKFLVILMVVAVASFLFTGCLPGTTTPETPTEPTEPTPTPTTVAPIITAVTDIDITSTATQYVNKAEAVDGITVTGTAPTYSEVKVYINGITAGTGDAGVNGVFSVVVANADLIKAVKVEGAKTLYATAIEAGLAESASSNECKFTLDTVVPSIKSSSAKAGTAAVYQFVETTDSLNPTPGSDTGPFNEWLINTSALLIDDPLGDWFSIPAGTAWTPLQMGEQIISPFASVPATNPLMAGVVNWKLEVITVAAVTTMRVYNLSAVPVTSIDYTYTTGMIISTSWIPGLNVWVAPLWPSAVGGYCLITTTNTAATSGYIDVTFSEAVTGVSMLATTTVWTAFAATVNLAPTVTVRSATVARLTEAVAGTMAVGQAYSVSVSGIIDLAGNPIPVTAPSTSIGIVMP